MDKKLSFNHFLIISLAVHLGIGCGIGGWMIPYMKNLNLGKDKERVILLEIGWSEQISSPQISVKSKRGDRKKKIVKLAKKMPEKSNPSSGQKNGRAGKDRITLLGGSNSYLEEVRRRIERAKFYPPRAKMARVEGKVALEFQIDKFGRAQNVNLAQPSKHKILNMAARNILDKASPFPKPRDKLIIDKTIETTLVFALVY